MQAGNIVVLTGLNSTVTGDTLVASERAAETAVRRRQKLSNDGFDGTFNVYFQNVRTNCFAFVKVKCCFKRFVVNLESIVIS